MSRRFESCTPSPLAIAALALITVVVPLLGAAPVGAQPLASSSPSLLSKATSPATGLYNERGPASARRTAGFWDGALLTFGGAGGGLVIGAVAVSADLPGAATLALYGLGIAGGTTLTGRLFGIEGAPLGAVAGAAVGVGVVLLAAHTTTDDLSGAAAVGLLGLVVPPLLSASGYIIAPTLSGSGAPGLTLHARF